MSETKERKADVLTFDEIVAGRDVTIKRLDYGGEMKRLAKSIKCTDGTELSVQASRHHYCQPRTNLGPYSHVEVGFPTEPPPDSWMKYFDGGPSGRDRTDGVYGYVPVELVREYIESHGGEVAHDE